MLVGTYHRVSDEVKYGKACSAGNMTKLVERIARKRIITVALRKFILAKPRVADSPNGKLRSTSQVGQTGKTPLGMRKIPKVPTQAETSHASVIGERKDPFQAGYARGAKPSVIRSAAAPALAIQEE
jgi:hypothetical protein